MLRAEKVFPDQATVGGSGEKLPFPKFHRSILSESYWNAAEEKGRIKIQLSAGYMVIKDELQEFVKLVDHVVFSFQPAPLGESACTSTYHCARNTE